MFEVMPQIITIVGVLIFIITIVVFIFAFILMFNPKIRGKFMSKQIKATKYMMDDSKDDIQDVSTNLAKATKDSIEITTRAIKKGFTDDYIYCKHSLVLEYLCCVNQYSNQVMIQVIVSLKK